METITLDQYIYYLIQLKNADTKAGSLPIIYSHDDEGNDYQFVVGQPCFAVCSRVNNFSTYVDVDNLSLDPSEFKHNSILIN